MPICTVRERTLVHSLCDVSSSPNRSEKARSWSHRLAGAQRTVDLPCRGSRHCGRAWIERCLELADPLDLAPPRCRSVSAGSGLWLPIGRAATDGAFPTLQSRNAWRAPLGDGHIVGDLVVGGGTLRCPRTTAPSSGVRYPCTAVLGHARAIGREAVTARSDAARAADRGSAARFSGWGGRGWSPPDPSTTDTPRPRVMFRCAPRVIGRPTLESWPSRA